MESFRQDEVQVTLQQRNVLPEGWDICRVWLLQSIAKLESSSGKRLC